MTFINRTLIRKIILLLAPLAAVFIASPVDRGIAQNKLEVSRVYARDARLRDAFLKAVETIKSDYERGRVLSALLKNKQIG